MVPEKLIIPVTVQEGKVIEFVVYPESENSTLFRISDTEAEEFGEYPFQMMEGCCYEYSLSEGYDLVPINGVVTASKVNPCAGRITPGIYTGLLTILVHSISDRQECGRVHFEVRSTKTSYREDYRLMLEEITERCTSLVIQHGSPVSQYFTQEYSANAETLYQQFAFVKSVIDAPEFFEAVYRVISSPVTKWKEHEEFADTRKVRSIDNSILKQFVSRTDRIDISSNHPLYRKMSSIPAKVNVIRKIETVDTPENRFIKHVLSVFRTFSAVIKEKMEPDSREYHEANIIEESLENILQASLFKEISPPQSLTVSSPVLQRKEGYREVLRAWLMFDVASKLFWKGGDDVYSAGKRNVALLYEYWLFFKLLELMREVFNIEPKTVENLIEQTPDGLGLKLKSGKYIPLKGIYESSARRLNVQFSYNRTFSGESGYPKGGSWTKSMRPDYTLSIWPFDFTEDEAEAQEIIVHVHFDAKYKISNPDDIFGNGQTNIEVELENEKIENDKGIYKRADLLKMHAYKDAIRRTGGAYVLYPGSEPYTKAGFHEILPGIGAFPIRPSRTENGTRDLALFIQDVLNHFLNRASQHERQSYHTYQVHESAPDYRVFQALPERVANSKLRHTPPAEIFVLVGWCKDEEHLRWIMSRRLYNCRMDTSAGSLRLKPDITGAAYLLLHGEEGRATPGLLRILSKGPRIMSKEALKKKGYPGEPKHDNYLVFDVERAAEFVGVEWAYSKLESRQEQRKSAWPYAVSLAELLAARAR